MRSRTSVRAPAASSRWTTGAAPTYDAAISGVTPSSDAWFTSAPRFSIVSTIGEVAFLGGEQQRGLAEPVARARRRSGVEGALDLRQVALARGDQELRVQAGIARRLRACAKPGAPSAASTQADGDP